MFQPALKGERTRIIPIQEKHLESVRSLRNDPSTNVFLTSTTYINKNDQKKWFTSLKKDKTRLYFVIEDKSGNFIGTVRCDMFDRVNKTIRVGIDIVPERRRQGYATEAYQKLLEYLFYQLKMHRVWLFVLDTNKGALQLYKKLGFTKEGSQREAIYRDHTFHDYIMMSLLKSEYEKKSKKK